MLLCPRFVFISWTMTLSKQVEPLALSAADGMNACIFAYGQTGSGKTHTMIGDAKGGEMAGVSYRTMNKLFEVLGHRQRQQVHFFVCLYSFGGLKTFGLGVCSCQVCFI